MLYLLYGIRVWTATPNFLMVAIVASRYGFETRFPSIVKLTPFSVNGALINNADTNWLEKLPGIVTSPPDIFPVIWIGGFPSVDEHLAPILSKASNKGCIGLVWRLESPVRVVWFRNRLAIPDAILMVVPEFSALILGTNSPSPIDFLAMIEEFCFSIWAPKFLLASIVAFVSAENNTLSTLLSFPASAARKIALCV